MSEGPGDASAHFQRQSILEDRMSIRVAPSAGRILVVDDLAANVNILTRLLAPDGHEILTASNGEEALDLVTRERPDLVLLDVMTPRLDGFEVCRRLKQHASTRLIPVVLITALDQSSDKIRGLEAGADDFLQNKWYRPICRSAIWTCRNCRQPWRCM